MTQLEFDFDGTGAWSQGLMPGISVSREDDDILTFSMASDNTQAMLLSVGNRIEHSYRGGKREYRVTHIHRSVFETRVRASRVWGYIIGEGVVDGLAT